jgi:hypothetical protein
MNDHFTSVGVSLRRITTLLMLTALGILCGPPIPGAAVRAQQKSVAVPSWYSKLPHEPRVLYAKATATSKDKQLAIDKALHDARMDLGRMVQGRVDSIRRSAEKEIALERDAAERYTKAAEQISVSLKGSRIKNQKQSRKGKTWTAFVVVELPVGAMSDALVRAVRDDGVLSPTFGPTQAFRTLDAEATAYRGSLQKKKK